MQPQHVRQCLYVVGEEIARRRIGGYPIPSALFDLHRVLTDEVSAQRLRQQWQRELSANGHPTTQTRDSAAALETTTDVANRLGISERSARRRAARGGVSKVGGVYLFREEQS